MMSSACRGMLVLACAAAIATPAWAEGAPVPAQAAGVEVWSSTDSDHTDVVKLLGRFALREDGPDRRLGFAVERAWFTPQGGETRKDQRVYVDVADRAGDWRWTARLGTDGRSWLGSANIRSADWSKEVFLEREIIETPRGVDEGIYYTFVGASMDVPASKAGVFTVMAGVQGFTGSNERLHLRGNYVHIVDPSMGLSAQVRARYFHSTAPGEFDYFSPRDFLQVLPVMQMRRFTTSGWMILGAAGFGAQHATAGGWESARLAELRFESPRDERGFRAFGHLQYSNNSLSGAGNYHYAMARLGLTKTF